MDRRRFLQAAGVSALGVALAPLAGRAAPTAGVPALRRLLGRPAIDNSPEIKHIVVLMMENHSFDNILGTLDRPGLDGLTFAGGIATNSNPDANGYPIAAYHLPTTCQDDNHVGQSWESSHRQWNGGAMDGFVATSGKEGMGYYTADDLPVTHALASVFPVCDRWFCSTMCQTYPNRLFLLSGSSQGATRTDTKERAQSSRPAAGTIFDSLDNAGISWKNYLVDLGDSMLFGPVYFAKLAALGHVSQVADFFVDAAAGTLPAFSLIDPESFEGSEENPQNMAVGEAYVWAIATAVMSSPVWKHTMLLITYDEHGGYYDHVPPVPLPNPADGFHPNVPNLHGDDFTYSGFRVPTIVVSPWARRDYVSHTVYDHTSLLRFMENKWALPPLTQRDAKANDMIDLFDFSSPAFARPPRIPKPNLVSETLNCLRHGQTGISKP